MPDNDIFPLIPRYPIQRDTLEGVISDEAESGRVFSRLKRAVRLRHNVSLQMSGQDVFTLDAWYQRFATSWFILRYLVAGQNSLGGAVARDYAVRFSSKPTWHSVRNIYWEAECVFDDVVGMALNSYPDPIAGHPSAFQEETDGYAAAGTWTQHYILGAHGDGVPDLTFTELTNANTNETDTFSWIYSGYGFRLWARTGPDLGKMGVYLDSVLVETVDLYAAVATSAKVVLTKLNVPLDLHLITILATNTKNGASSAKTIIADALETMV